MTNSLPKAYSYIRFSTPEQAKGDSYRRQRDAAKQYCLEQGLHLVADNDYLFFDSGRSAFKGKHLEHTGQLARFLGYVQEGIIEPGSVLIIESLDRLSRERLRAALPRFLEILDSGINIYTSIDRKLYTKEFNNIDLIFSILEMSRAHSESSLKGERVSEAWKQKQKDARETKKPLGKACPYWLRLVDGKYQPIPERVRVLDEIFRLGTTGYGQRAIAKILNASSTPIFGSSTRNPSGLWGSSSVGKILCNRAVLGEYQPTGLVDGKRDKIGEPVSDFFPVVISEDLFFDAQSSRSTRNVSKATKAALNFNLWQGLAKCSLCGESMHLVNKGRPPKGGKYLRCYGSAKGRCTNKLVELGRSERAFMEILAKVDSLSLIQDSQAKIQKEISRVDLQITKIKKRQAEIESQILDVNDDLPSFVMQAASRFDQELKELKKQRNELKRDSQREKIINKEDFFSKLDLVTFEGRAKANYLLKALKVKVCIERLDDKVCYAIDVEGVLAFVMKQASDQIDYYPYTGELTELLRSQGDDAAFAAMHSSMVARAFELLERVREQNRIDAMLAHKSVPKKFPT
ncbi:MULTISPECIES: recombinase family protein [unclassified Pseudomonas]|uniref:recombinase family protein n=1 Tax=unclassified Pseudomonas TaxID=196821 RepID=UPI00249C3505|nr:MULTISPECIES: recombinase family protein [unclassified Pseudomonas]MDI3247710.1 recombinase family protein [Pseudomonas sp. AL10]MDI3263678.1 recombinase family protein [Pseudomonas sp. AL15]